MNEQQHAEGWYDNPEGEGERYWDGEQWTDQYRGGDGKAKWWARSFTLPLWALLVGGFVLIGIGAAGGGDDPEPAAQEAAETVTVTETVAAEPGEQVTVTETVEPSPEQAEPPADEGAYTAGQYEFADVQLAKDFVDDFEARARITNTGSAVSAVIIRMTVFKGGSVVATLDGTVQDFGSGETRTIEFTSTDDWDPDWDEIEFQVDTQF